MLKLPKLILASGSPRRAEILNAVGWEFEKYSADIDETEFVGEKPKDYVQRLAQSKAVIIAKKYPGALVLGADTIVVIDNKIIGKPKDLAEAEKMLRTLSGKWHEVLTGVALVIFLDGKQKTKVRQQRTRVKFAEINDAEIKLLVEKGEPLDKAGAYAVQAQAALFIEEIEGDYWNVVGLPINLVYKMLDAY
jgi:septum formation protein